MQSRGAGRRFTSASLDLLRLESTPVMLNPADMMADPSSAASQSRPGALPPVSSLTLPNTGSEYLLVCEACSQSLNEGTWQFTLEQADGTPVFSADDTDIGDLNRLTLLAAVRGLESIDGPSSVTLLSNNRYLIRSLSDSLPRWRQNDFVWEHFGRRIEVQHADLWRRIDRALSIHRVEAVLISSRLVSRGSTAGSDRRVQRRASVANRFGTSDRAAHRNHGRRSIGHGERIARSIASMADRQFASSQPAVPDQSILDGRLDASHLGPRTIPNAFHLALPQSPSS